MSDNINLVIFLTCGLICGSCVFCVSITEGVEFSALSLTGAGINGIFSFNVTTLDSQVFLRGDKSFTVLVQYVITDGAVEFEESLTLGITIGMECGREMWEREVWGEMLREFKGGIE